MRVPIATYRLQFQPRFGFGQATGIVDYLSDLGISDIYASPIFRARPGSRHGYDGVDPNALNPELGSGEDWQRLVERLREQGMGWLQDTVPNHMAFHADNWILADVLENGATSPYYEYFDIHWDHPLKDLHRRVMAPFLGHPYSACLKNGDIRLGFDSDGFAAIYANLKFPLRTDGYLEILEPSTALLKTQLGEDNPDYLRWIDALDGLESLVLISDTATRRDRRVMVKQTLWTLFGESPAIRRATDDCLALYNGTPGDIDSFRLLDRLLSRQWFRLCYWKNANEEINYRRFFDINELIALRQEKPAVFEHTHRLLSELAAANIVTGIRIDHIDGLADPEDYLQNLKGRLVPTAYVLVEKILAPDETLPAGWPVQGTTGYDVAHWLNALFVCKDNETRFSEMYTGFSGRAETFEQVVYDAKKWVLSSRMLGDLENLARRIKKISALKRFADNLTLLRIKAALFEVLARFPVYRTYLGRKDQRRADRDTVCAAFSRSVEVRPHLRIEFDFIRNLLLENLPFAKAAEDVELRRLCRQAVRAFQQLSTALMAKGLEDTAFYRYHRLVSLNEVGGEPTRFGCDIDRFHEFIVRRSRHWPHAMNSTATHDSKRGEDARARLNVLSEIPAEWHTRVSAWHRITLDRRTPTSLGPLPDRNTVYLLYQTLIGAWPQEGPVTKRFAGRIKDYMVKAAREAGENTSWVEPREEYEAALNRFVDAVLDPSASNGFMPAFVPFCKKIIFFGLFNSLSQCVLKIALPGVPDFYQGTELPHLALVDPDNRREVDYGNRMRLLAAMRQERSDPLAQVEDLLDSRDDGRIKLFVMARGLAARREHSDLFQNGGYLPLETVGPFDRNIVAFARIFDARWCVVAVPRFVTALVPENQDPLGRRVWRDTAIVLPPEAPRSWYDIFARRRLKGAAEILVGEALQHFPVSLLLGEKTP